MSESMIVFDWFIWLAIHNPLNLQTWEIHPLKLSLASESAGSAPHHISNLSVVFEPNSKFQTCIFVVVWVFWILVKMFYRILLSVWTDAKYQLWFPSSLQWDYSLRWSGLPRHQRRHTRKNPTRHRRRNLFKSPTSPASALTTHNSDDDDGSGPESTIAMIITRWIMFPRMQWCNDIKCNYNTTSKGKHERWNIM